MAMPGILQQLARTSPRMGQIKQMLGMVRSAGNPQAMLTQLAAGNPAMKQVMDIVNQHGGDPDRAFRTLAEQNGIDPQEILSMLR